MGRTSSNLGRQPDPSGRSIALTCEVGGPVGEAGWQGEGARGLIVDPGPVLQHRLKPQQPAASESDATPAFSSATPSRVAVFPASRLTWSVAPSTMSSTPRPAIVPPVQVIGPLIVRSPAVLNIALPSVKLPAIDEDVFTPARRPRCRGPNRSTRSSGC